MLPSLCSCFSSSSWELMSTQFWITSLFRVYKQKWLTPWKMTKSFQSCLTHCNPRDCSPPVSYVHGMLKARVLEWFTMPFSKGSSLIRDRTLPPELPGKLDFMKNEDDSENRPSRAASKGPHLPVPRPCMMPLPWVWAQSSDLFLANRMGMHVCSAALVVSKSLQPYGL